MLGSKRVVRAGSWTAGSSCLAAGRGNAQTPYYAQRFTFTLAAAARVEIDLSSSVDAYLCLFAGHGRSGRRLASNNDADSTTRDARLAADLPAGGYTIDATTFEARSTGTFTLKVSADAEDAEDPDDAEDAVTVAVDGLEGAHRATVGAELSFGFGFSPRSAAVSVKSIIPPGLALAVTSAAGKAAVTGAATRAGVYTAVFEASHNGQTATATTVVTATCPAGHSRQSDRSCKAAEPVRVGPLSKDEATVDRWFTARFRYEPASARVSRGAVDPEGFVPLLSARDGSGSLLGRPRLAGGYEVVVVLEHGGVEKTFEFTVDASCAEGLVELDDRRCRTLSINSLQAEADAVVDEPLTVVFGYSPASAALSVPRARLARDGLRVEVEDPVGRRAGVVALTLTARRAAQWEVPVAVSHRGRTERASIKIRATCPDGKVPHTDGTGTCTPTASVPPGCVATALDSRARSWWGRMVTTRVYAAPLGDGPSTAGVCASVGGGDTVSYLYSMRVPASLKPTRARITLRTRETNPLVSSLTVWKRISGGPVNTSRVQLVTRSRVADGAATPIVEPLPGGNYILEIARTTMDHTHGFFTLEVWHPLPERVHADVKRLGNTGLDGAGATLEEFLDARGSLCYGAHPTCPTNNDNPFDPPSIEFPWLPFITDRCSIPRGLVGGAADLNTWLKSLAASIEVPFSTPVLLHLAQYLNDTPSFGDQTVSFVYACMRHDFNWRNLYRIEHHLHHGDTWNSQIRLKADTRLLADLRELCSANQGSPVPSDTYFGWRIEPAYMVDCRNAARTIFVGVVAYPMFRVTYDSDEV